MKHGFKKATFCANDSCCVEVAFRRNKVKLRDTRGKIVEYTRKEWNAFIKGVKKGEFDTE